MNAPHHCVDVVVTWAGSVLAVERLAPGESFTIGPRGRFSCDHPSIPGPAFAVVTRGQGTALVRAAPGMRLFLDDAPAAHPVLELTPGQGRARLELGALAFELRFQTAAPPARAAGAADRPFLLVSSSALALQACLVAVLVLSGAPAAMAPPLPTSASVRAVFDAPHAAAPHVPPPASPPAPPQAPPSAVPAPAAAGRPMARQDERQRPPKAPGAPSPRELVSGALAALGLTPGELPAAPGLAGGLDQLRGSATAGMVDEGLSTRTVGPGGGGDTVAGPALWASGPLDNGLGELPGLIAREKRSAVVVLNRDFAPGDGLTREEIQRVISGALPRIKHCYERELGAAPDLEGKVAPTFTIGASGDVLAVRSEHSLGVPAVASCVERVVRGLSFPRPRGGGAVVVTYPFVFTLAGG